MIPEELLISTGISGCLLDFPNYNQPRFIHQASRLRLKQSECVSCL